MNFTPSTRWDVNRADVSHERLDGEVIAVNLVTGRYYSMSGPAADAWSAVVGGGSADETSQSLREIYGSDPSIESDVVKFISACVDAQLLVEANLLNSRHALAEIPDDYQRAAWTTPVLEEYEDLQDLILVDPVHDTSALGWPHVEDSPEQN